MKEGEDYIEFDPRKKDLALDEQLTLEYVEMLKDITKAFFKLNTSSVKDFRSLYNIILSGTMAFAAENTAAIIENVKKENRKAFAETAEETFLIYMARLKEMLRNENAKVD